ncbi:MAG TPA: AbrB/MazE/SpoVT family DNA-binding domain-containing protein [Thermoflexales bacterium]|nr:AbrB/MazE/SpoVT family DNA-binding domain-containing protein [Thermoflexales bacterium]HQW34687.1 AbrB/MazE/SpoVT family DNA-binding domain-containing protein [Thermoflexales bacterium]HQZ22000.1 AbrB/MazE/SpoVT family DNA-binding domain-containing protein [Thermoflexales bacterium]HRA01012.1 AbrB/MazE/SpoVT family DNA-binding domain-containing protein [Thermoflexales bacterium]
MKLTSRVTTKGQITIPQEVREKFGFLPHTQVEFVVTPYGARIVRAKNDNPRGKQIVASMRTSRRKLHRTTDEIMALTRSETE